MLNELIARKLDELSTNKSLDRKGLEQQQARKFLRLVDHVQQRSPFYRALINNRRIDIRTCTPSDFPVLTKGELLDNFDDIVTDRSITKKKLEAFLSASKDPTDLFDDRYIVCSSSGTSGQTAIFVYSLEEYFASMARVLASGAPTIATGRKLKVAFVGAVHGHFAGITMTSSLRLLPDSDTFDLLPIDILSPQSEIVETLNRFQPDMLYTYSSALCELAERKARGDLLINPYALRCGGEALRPDDRRFIEETFGAPLTNVYASSECLYMGAGRADMSMVLFEDDLIFELHDEHTCVTNLFNYTLPLIRYRFDEVLLPVAGAQSGPYRTVNELIGRSETNLVLKNRNGDDDMISAIALALLHLPGVRRFQFVSRTKTAFAVRVSLQSNNDMNPDSVVSLARRELAQVLQKKKMENIRFDVELVDEFAADPISGKFKLVVPDR
jgi:phenylacetate-CoA ligase